MNIQRLLRRRVAEVIERKHLETALKTGKKLRVKLGWGYPAACCRDFYYVHELTEML